MKKLILILIAAAAASAVTVIAQSGNTFITNDTSKPVPVRQVSPIPTGATPKTGTSGNVANGSAVAQLAAVSGKTNYITGLQITAAGATAALVANVTVTGTGTTMTYTFVFPAGATTAAQSLIVDFPVPVGASATNTAIVVTLPASGAGGTNAAVSVQGYDL